MAVTAKTISSSTSAWLNWMRALAAITVFAGHLRCFCIGDFSSHGGHVPLIIKVFYHVVGLGHSAVIVFFVLSGFLVGGSVLNELRETGGLRVKVYAVARVARIYSVLIPALVLGATADWLGLRVVHASAVYEYAHFSSILGQNVAETLNAGTFVANLSCLQTIVRPNLGSNGPLWSLANEFWYYFLFPALLITVWPRTAWRMRIIAAVLAVALLWMLGADKDIYFVFWLAGVGVRLAPEVRIPPGWLGLVVFGGALIVQRLPSLIKVLGGIGMDAVVAVAFSVLLWSVAQRPSRMPSWLAKSGQQLASSSFTLYACHFPLAALMASVLMQWLGWTLPGDVLDPRAWVVYGAFLSVLAGACFGLSLFTERKHHQLKRWLTKCV